MSRAARPATARPLGTWAVILLVALLPLALALLAPPPLAADGPSVSASPRDVSTAAMDRLQRALSGALDVALDAPQRSGLAWTAQPSTPAPVAPAAPAVALAAETVRTL